MLLPATKWNTIIKSLSDCFFSQLDIILTMLNIFWIVHMPSAFVTSYMWPLVHFLRRKIILCALCLQVIYLAQTRINHFAFVWNLAPIWCLQVIYLAQTRINNLVLYEIWPLLWHAWYINFRKEIKKFLPNGLTVKDW